MQGGVAGGTPEAFFFKFARCLENVNIRVSQDALHHSTAAIILAS